MLLWNIPYVMFNSANYSFFAIFDYARKFFRDNRFTGYPVKVHYLKARIAAFSNWTKQLQPIKRLRQYQICGTHLLDISLTARPYIISKFVKSTSPLLRRVIANYMMWRIAASSVSYLSEDARDLQLNYSKKITGTGKRQPRWKECMAAVSGR